MFGAIASLAGGALSSLSGEDKKAKSARHATKRAAKATKYYWQKSRWTPERRSEMMKGIQGFIAKYVSAGKKRASRTGADLGRGGGYYGGEVERTRRAGLNIGAERLSQTYAPPAMPGMPQQYLSTGTGQTMDALSQIGGTLGGIGMGKYLYGNSGNMKWPNIPTIRGGQGGGYGF